MYRPEGLVNPFQEEVNYCKSKDLAAPEHQLRAFEAGADAMYNALWKMAEESPTKTFTLDANVVNVFSSEEK